MYNIRHQKSNYLNTKLRFDNIHVINFTTFPNQISIISIIIIIKFILIPYNLHIKI